ncbi:hypothetical protein [Atopomonas hussainii]|uniref:hypothetical protein n=1 Tax=Atopomonas hussainii TaxID=1429083 RepID=UPI000A68DDC9|nr:hypothetical protein [Atopomonas hussainii]
MLPISPNLIRLCVAVLLPATACLGYYRVEAVAPASPWLSAAIILAYPVSLMGFAGVLLCLRQTPIKTSLLVLASAATLLPIGLIQTLSN